MGSFFVSPPDETDWHLSSTDFSDMLRSAWPEASVREVSNPESNHLLDWTLWVTPERRLDGSLDREGQAVHMDGDVQDAAAVALLLRSRVPESQPLVFYDEAYSDSVDLSEDVTEDQIVRPFVIST